LGLQPGDVLVAEFEAALAGPALLQQLQLVGINDEGGGVFGLGRDMESDGLFDQFAVLIVFDIAVPAEKGLLGNRKADGAHDGDVGIFTGFDETADGLAAVEGLNVVRR